MTEYRYTLSRPLGMIYDQKVLFVMHNPSVATTYAGADDPTIRRCLYFAKRLANASEVRVVNLYAARADEAARLRNGAWPGADHDPVSHQARRASR